MSIKAIFFDIGGVLAKEDREKQYSELAEIMNFDMDKFQELRENKVDLFAEGKISEEEYLSFFSKVLEIDFKKLRDNWTRLAQKYYQIDISVQNTVRKLKDNYILGTLTNIIPLHNQVRKTDGLYKDFKIKLLSFERGYKKPNPLFYKLIFEETHLNPQ